MSSRRSHSPVRSTRLYRDWSPPPLRRKRSMSRSDIPNWTAFPGKSKYLVENARLYPPDGYNFVGKSSVYNRDWPSSIQSEYDRYDRHRKDYRSSNPSYVNDRDHVKVREKKYGLSDLFDSKGRDHRGRLDSNILTGVYSRDGHVSLRDAAARREDDAYHHAKYRTSFFQDYPRIWRSRGDDSSHYKSLSYRWNEHEEARRDRDEHDLYGSRRRRNSFSTLHEIDRDSRRRARSRDRDTRSRRYVVF